MANPNAEVPVAVSPAMLLDSSKYTCDVCYKGFPRSQNLSLHRRVHNDQNPVPPRVFLCPEPTCVHHNPSHAIGDFDDLKKHYLREHDTEKKHKCDTCSKAYSLEADLKAHVCASG